MTEIELIGKQQIQIEKDKIKIAGYKERMNEIQNIIQKEKGLKDKIKLMYAVSLEEYIEDILSLCW